MKTIGILGGTFNPIHYGHLRMAQELAESLGIDSIRFIPAANPPHKSTYNISASHRAAMVNLAIADNPLFRIDEQELNRAGHSYTIDTLQNLRDELGHDVSIILFMGSDAFTQFDTWHRWQEIITLCHIALVQRPQTSKTEPSRKLSPTLESFLHNHYTETSDDLHTSPAGYITMRQITALDISSTAIRDAFQQGKATRYLMPDSVIDYIQAHQLYL
ncbi:nicotinate-nucleotide adenylyltransferase [Methylotenera sp. L2L1]|uniref:nicotinate-nucleotide adenylyltransferase n=1 Tax=Methylotenera sp. L2L1 TaxID=1502770 RepID=UPI00055CF963|nr:nicotinate-nucleotide adenylyltransferase [Methylotenera sp. L2L1]